MKSFKILREKFSKKKEQNEPEIVPEISEQSSIPAQHFIQFKKKNFEEVKFDVESFSFELSSSAFILIISASLTENQLEVLCGILREKLPPDRPWILQAIVDQKLKFLSFENGLDEELGSSKENFIEISKNSFNSQSFFDVLSILRCSLTDFNLKEEFEKFYEPKNENFFFDNAIDSKLLMLVVSSIFYSKSDSESFLMRAIKVRRLDIFLAFLCIFDEDSLDVDEIMKIDRKLPVTLIENGNFEVFKFLMRFETFASSISAFYSEIMKVTVEKEFFHFLPFLRNLKLFPDFSLKTEDEVRKLHVSIKAGKLKEVESFTEKNPSMILCYGPSSEGTPALEFAIDCNQFQIYSFLCSKGFATDRKRELDKKIKELAPASKQKIRKENLKFAIKDPIGGILNKCDFFSSSDATNFQNVHEMLGKLNKIEEIRELMKLVAETEVKITFDFKTEGVNGIDPTNHVDVLGLADYREDQLLVGRNRSESQRYGTFAHELTHYGLYKLYDNFCLPYCGDDKERKKIYDEVFRKSFESYERMRGKVEGIIKVVFECYRKGYEQEAELIVRVNDVLAHYHDQPEKVKRIEEIFPELFNFYRTFVLRDLKLPKVYENKELNKKFGLLDKALEWSVNDGPATNFLSDENVQIFSNIPLHTISKIYKEISSENESKIEINVKNIFIDATKTKTLVKDLMEMTSMDRVIILTDNVETLKDLKVFSFDVILVSPLNEIHLQNFKKLEDIYEWRTLPGAVKAKISQIPIKFKGERFHLREFDDVALTKEVLSIICSGERKVEGAKVLETFEYIPRKICRYESKDEEVDVANFLVSVASEEIVLITDKAGNGKTVTLRQIEQALKGDKKNFLIIFVTLREHKEALSKVSQDFPSFMAEKILKLNELDKIIFNMKYHKNLVKVLFDGFDEVSPDRKIETFRLLEQHKKNDKSQIFITARTHLKKFLEEGLNSAAFTLKPLDKSENIQFLVNYWKNYNKDEKLLRKCAEILVNKVSEVFKLKSDFIGLLLPIKVMAEHFKEDLTENFADSIKSLNVFKVYDEIFKCFSRPDDKSGEFPTHNILSYVYPSYERFALRKCLGNDHHLFGNCASISEEDLEELARCGIVSFDGNREIHFNHQTFFEFIIARFIKITLQNLELDFQYLNDFVEFFFRIMSENGFEITRMFLNDVVSEISVDNKNLEKFSSALVKVGEKKMKGPSFMFFFCTSEIPDPEFIDSFVNENFFEFFLFVLLVMRRNPKTVFHKIVSREIEDGNVLTKILQNIKEDEKFEKFLNETFTAVSKEEILKLLMARDSKGNSIFHYFTQNSVSDVQFIKLWNIIENNFKRSKIQEIFNLKNKKGINFFDYGLSSGLMSKNKIKRVSEIVVNFKLKELFKEFMK